jgi:hypothetical protein
MTGPRCEIRDRENGTSIEAYIDGNGKPHFLLCRGSQTLHFEPTDAQLHKLRTTITGLLGEA